MKSNKRKTTEEFIKEATLIHGERYDYNKVDYINYKSKLIIRCAIHGEFVQISGDHLNGHGCKKCGNTKRIEKESPRKDKIKHKVISKNHRKTTDAFIKDATLVHGDRYDYSMVDYKNAKTKVLIKCMVHGYFMQYPTNHLSGGNGCIKCVHDYNKKTTEQFITEAKLVHGDCYNYSSSKYVNAHNKVEILCYKHDIFLQKAKDHLSGKGCKKCYYDKSTKTTDEFIKEAKLVHGDRYDYNKVKYTLNTNKITIICKIHFDFYQQPSTHINGSGCPICNLSKGEMIIMKFLRDSNITFECEYKFKDCLNIKSLRFDFYLPELNICIEFDGIQHYEPIPFFGGEREFIKRKQRDDLKDSYCISNGIELLRIRYDEDILELIKGIL